MMETANPDYVSLALDVAVIVFAFIGANAELAAKLPKGVRQSLPLLAKLADFFGANRGWAKNAEPEQIEKEKLKGRKGK